MDKENMTIEIDTTDYKIVNGDMTEEQLSALKARHGRIAEIEVADPEVKELHRGYFRRPDMKTMQAFSATAKSNDVKAAEVMFDNCWVGGSALMKTDAVYKLQAVGELQNIFGKCVSKLKNL